MTRNTKGILKILGNLLLITGIALFIPLFIAAQEGHPAYIQAFLVPGGISVALGLSLKFTFRKAGDKLSSKDGMLIVALVWSCASLIGALPYLLSGLTNSFISALFESISAFTTTGATIFEDVTGLPRCILFWRAFAQWIGGMGIIILLGSLMLSIGGGTARLLRAENDGFTTTKVAISKTATRFIYAIYSAFTLIEVLLLKAGGLSWFDSITFSFSTMATGGFTNYTDGVSSIASPFVLLVLGLFMVISGVDYTVYYRLFRKDRSHINRNSELKAYFGIMLVSALLIIINLMASGTVSDDEAVSLGLFNTISYMTSTGLTAGNAMEWPTFSRVLLTLLTFAGGCSSSTGGALKVIRIVVLAKIIWRSFSMRIHPNAVIALKVSGKPMKSGAANRILYYCLTYVIILIIGTFLLTFDAPDMETALTASAAALNNTGSGFGIMGIYANYHMFSGFSQAVLCALMMLGRLEIYTFLLLFSRDFWKEKI